MSDDRLAEPGTPPPHEEPKRQRIELECVGSFVAYAQDGMAHTIEIWTKFGSIHDRSRSRVAPGLMILTTTDGRDVEYVGRRIYRLHDQPEISLSSADENAP